MSNATIEEPGGSDIRLANIFKKISKKFFLEGIMSTEEVDFFKEKKIEIKILKQSVRFNKKYGYIFGVLLAYSTRLLQILINIPKKEKNLIIYSPTDILIDVIPSIIAKIFNHNSRLICIIHHIIPENRKCGNKLRNIFSLLTQKISHFLLRYYADMIITINKINKKHLEESGFSGKVKVVGNGIDYLEIWKIIQKNKIIEKKYDGVFLGRVNYSKGAIDLVEVWKIVVQKYPLAKLMIIGNKEKIVFEEMKKLIDKYHLSSNIIFKGFLSREEVFKHLIQCKIFVFPSYEEGWGISIAEAMACGLPVVSYDLDAYKDIFFQGMEKCEIGDRKSLADTVIDFLSNRDKYEYYSKKASELGKKLSWATTVEKELSLINTIFKND